MGATVRPANITRERLIHAVGDMSVGNWLDKVTSGLQVADKLITSAQVLALNTTAIEVVPAPGAGKYLMFEGAVVFLDYAGTAYDDDAGEDLVFTYTDKSGAEISHTADGSAFDGTADTVVFVRPLNAAASVLEEAANAPICLFLKTGNWATGNSPLKVRVYYRVVDKVDLERIA
jgi:hypothetical protein